MFKGKNLTKILAVTLVVVVGIGAAALLSSQVKAESEIKKKVAYVDMQKIFENHPKKVAAELEFSQEVKGLKQQLKGELKNKLNQATGEEKQKLVSEYEKKLKQQANERQQELIEPILKEIDQTIKEVAENEGVAVVLSKETVIYGGRDLTPEVLEKIKAKAKKEKEDNQGEKKSGTQNN